MPTFLRIIAIAFWTIGAFVAWIFMVYCSLRLLVFLEQKYHFNPPAWLASGPNIEIYGVMGLGTMVFTTTVLFLALRGKLPGTRKATARARGFDVATSRDD